MHENEIRDMTEWPAGTVARLKVQTSPASTSWPYAEKLPHGRGWQSGEIHYPESQVVSVEAVFEDVRASTVTTEAELNALPEGTLIESGTFILRHRRRIKQWQQVMRIDGEPCHPYDMEPADVPVPATVLFRPV